MKHSSPPLDSHIQIHYNYDYINSYQFLVNKAWLNAYFLLYFWGVLLNGPAKATGTRKSKLKIEQSTSPNFYWKYVLQVAFNSLYI